MQRLELQKDLAAGELGQRRRPDHRRLRHRPGDRLLGAPDVVEGYRQLGSGGYVVHRAGSRVRVATAAARPGTR